MAEVLEYHQRLTQEQAPARAGGHHGHLGVSPHHLPGPGVQAAVPPHFGRSAGRKRTFAETNTNIVVAPLPQEAFGGAGYKRTRGHHSTCAGAALASTSQPGQDHKKRQHAHAAPTQQQREEEAAVLEGRAQAQLRGQLVDHLVSIVGGTSHGSLDAMKGAMHKALRLFEKRVLQGSAAQAKGSKGEQVAEQAARAQQQQAAAAAKVQDLERENAILKRAVAIQNERIHHDKQGEAQEAAAACGVLRQALVNAQENVRQLELQNYSLKAHLKQMSDCALGDSMGGGHPNRDIF
mmetsp:Transcript_2180/g.5506  ORF Transcript_2180/g.5506 Transcript_2180/m.5506 type:complete len:293 (-) Transcript_2180:77-955(-)